MEVGKGEERQNEQAATLFRSAELESQRRSSGRTKKRQCRVICGVFLLCLLVVILAVALSLRNRSAGKEGEKWLVEPIQETQPLLCPSGFSRSPLILISLDGFRAEYLKDHASHIPILNKLRNAGTTTPHMRPVYPTKTFPNHYSIVTGLYPESHGIVDNKMYDVTQNVLFSLKTEEKFNPKWYQGEPIWITAMHNKLKTGTVFWPGSDVAINGSFPNFYKKYDKSFSFEKRLTKLFDLLSLPQEERPDFYTLYLDEPDSAGHRYGPGSKQVIQALENVDRILGMLMDGLTERKLQSCVNLMIVSDHGMEVASCDKAFYVSTYQEDTHAFMVIQGPAARIRPSRLPENYFSCEFLLIISSLSSCRVPNQPMRPYLKENLPKRMHFANNKRIERGHLYMKEGWQAALNQKEVKYCTGGFHGSDNIFTNMQAIFIGYGPGFKSNTVVPPFENIELYNVMCDLLDIPPAPNNGTHGSLNHLLKRPVHLPVHPAQLSHETPCGPNDPALTDDLQCSCASQTKAVFPSGTQVSLRRLHQPFDTPRVVQAGATFCVLYHSDYLNGYSKDHLMPLWVSYTLQPLVKLEACVRADVRIPPAASQLCLRYRNNSDLSYGLLHPPCECLFCVSFPTIDVWTHFHNVLLPKYSQQLNGVNIMSGPIFDKDFDGNVDAIPKESRDEAPIPTHFFVILTSCGNATFSPVNCQGPLQARSFILPHRPDHTESCATGPDLMWVEDWLHFHTARVRDIELLTGLSFYHNRLSVEETLQLKTFLHTA
uniref:Ectonucleotide pyrophosphatase/phosphodiesterase family member 1-like n=1 Tax=Echeneis naucrates TaxID=173247 RepID=A0A665WKF0_ECHNA